MIVVNQWKTMPFPFFLVDSECTIIGVSEESNYQFPQVSNFLELVDLGSKNKVRQFIMPGKPRQKLEINLLTKQKSIDLYDVYIQWEEENQYSLFCIEKQKEINQLTNMMNSMDESFEIENLSVQEKTEELGKLLKKMQQLSFEQDNMKSLGKLASMIANDIQRPLTNIRGFLQLLQPFLIDIGKDHYANIALEEINIANNILFEYLGSTKPPPPIKQQVRLQQLIVDVISMTETEVSKINCKIKYSIEHILPVIDIDPKQMKQVFFNIIKNAMESIQSSKNRGKGIITIKTKILSNLIEVSFQDNGKGMDKKTSEKIFTPFFSMKEKGTGIGLAVSMKMIEDHKGTIHAESKIGQGATLIVRLPMRNNSDKTIKEIV